MTPNLHPCRITGNKVFINDIELPQWIVKDGVIVEPGGAKGFNRVTVTFIVGEVICEDREVGDA